jgi:murein DD-endopeptidase MepM/ murein hydrolase activator NlpD
MVKRVDKVQDHTELKISEATYVRSGQRKQSEKKGVHRTQRIVSTAVVVLCFAFLIFGGVKVVSAYTSAFRIVVDGEGVATLPTEKEARDAIAQYLEEQSSLMGIEVVCGDSVKVERVSSREAEYSSIKDAVTVLSEGVQVLAKAVALCVNGQPVMYVANEEAARSAVEQAKVYFGREGEGGIEGVNVIEQVQVISSKVEPEQVLSKDEAVNMLLFGAAAVEYHVVQTEGETFEYIANRYGLEVEDIKDSNPAVDPTNMEVGKAVLLSKASPLINVQVKRSVISHEETPFETELRDNFDMPRGENKVVEEGMPGEDEITTEVIERNGLVVAQNRVSAVTVSEPVTRVVERGSRWVIASRGDLNMPASNGILAWPVASHKISSRYGYRSMGNHSGLDIESPVGAPIAAAADGTVVFAEYSGSYGNLIKIDHDGTMVTWYAHLQAYAVNVGDKVKRGQMIGSVGRTGRSTGPHVHFEVRFNGIHTDPVYYLETLGKDEEAPPIVIVPLLDPGETVPEPPQPEAEDPDATEPGIIEADVTEGPRDTE